MKSKLIKLGIVTSSLLILTGCSSYHVNKMYKDESVNIKKEIKKNKLIDSFSEVKVKDDYIKLASETTVNELLKKLSRLDGKNYYLSSNDIYVPYVEGYKGIRDFNSLKSYIEVTTNKTILVTENKLIKNAIKKVEIKDKEKIKNKLDRYRVSFGGKQVNLNDALLTVSNLTGYNFVYKGSRYSGETNTISESNTGIVDSSPESKNDSSNNISNDTKKLKSILISYTEGNVSNFLNYLETHANIFIDIDYKNKLFIVSKYKNKIMPLKINDRSIKLDSSSNDDSTSSSSIEMAFEYSIYEELEKQLKEKIKKENSISGDSNSYSISKANSTVSISATKDAMEEISKIVNKFNDDFSKNLNLEIIQIDLLVKNTNKFGLDINSDFLRNGIGFTIESGMTISETVNNKLTFTKGNSSGEGKIKNEIGYVWDVKKKTHRLRNLIPKNIDETREKSVVESISKEESSSENNEPTVTAKTEKLELGYKISLLPKISGNEVSLFYSPSEVNLDDIKKENFSGLELNLIETSSRKEKTELSLKDGEKVILSKETSFENSDMYEGMIPIKDFIVGGSKNIDLIKKETITLLSVKFEK